MFRFGEKLTILGATNSLLGKNLDFSFLCSTYDKILGNKFLNLCFLLDHALGHTPGANLSLHHHDTPTRIHSFIFLIGYKLQIFIYFKNIFKIYFQKNPIEHLENTESKLLFFRRHLVHDC